MDKIDALTKTLLYEKVAVIHAAFEDAPTTVAFVEVEKDLHRQRCQVRGGVCEDQQHQ